MRLKNRLRGNPKVAVLIQDRIKALMDVGVLKPVADDDVRVKAKAKGKKPGRKTLWFEKCSWAEVSDRPEALTVVTNLLLTADCFHSH